MRLFTEKKGGRYFIIINYVCSYVCTCAHVCGSHISTFRVVPQSQSAKVSDWLGAYKIGQAR